MKELNEKYKTHQFANFALDTKVGDLADKDGNLLLFRDIGSAYVKGFSGKGKKREFIESEGSAYSYSLSPFIVNMWTNSKKGSLTLISWQNFGQKLKYPTTLNAYTPQVQSLRLPLQRQTIVHDISYYDEVKVPVENENVLAVIEQEELKKLLESFKGRKFPLRELLQILLKSPALRSPECPKSGAGKQTGSDSSSFDESLDPIALPSSAL
jgi:hypothetical protein